MRPDLSVVEDLLATEILQKLPLLRITVLRNIVVESMEGYCKYIGYQSGFNTEIQFGKYDAIFQEAVAGDKTLLNAETDCAIIFTKLELLSPEIAWNISALSEDQIKDEMARIEKGFQNIIEGVRKQTGAIILWYGFELPITPAFGIYDNQIEFGQRRVVEELNRLLSRCLKRSINAYYIDTTLCFQRVGLEKFYDYRYWHIARSPYSQVALYEFALEAFKYIRAHFGKNKKCLVLDCDNTLWGGIVGEDGLGGIIMGANYPGSPYLEFQKEILNLYNRGVILALCSKNNENDVWEVFEKHPDMILKRKHITSAKINWCDKATNIKEIARDINIGLDSIVFFDDNEFEIGLIKQELPEVEAVHLPKDRRVEYRSILSGIGLFDQLVFTEEDRQRNRMYQEEAYRKKALCEAVDLESYYRSLDMIVKVSIVDEYSIPRVTQQTQKTNQFNLTTRRYSEQEIASLSKEHLVDILSLRYVDKLGDSGIVGTCILRYDNECVNIDTFLLSCRVLGRGVESIFLREALAVAKKRGATKAYGYYLPTKKNSLVENFYSCHGAIEVQQSEIKSERRFIFDLHKPLLNIPDYFKCINEVQQ